MYTQLIPFVTLSHKERVC